MSKYAALGTAVLSVAFAGSVVGGCSSSSDGDSKALSAEPASATTPTPAPGDDREAKLLTAAQGYVDALLGGKLAGVVGYLDPKVCDDEDQGSYALSIGQIKDVADGATMKILSVKLYPDGRGGADKYELSKNAPDSLRRLIKASFAESKTGAWNYRDGEWYLAGPCEDDDQTASPEPTS